MIKIRGSLWAPLKIVSTLILSLGLAACFSYEHSTWLISKPIGYAAVPLTKGIGMYGSEYVINASDPEVRLQYFFGRQLSSTCIGGVVIPMQITSKDELELNSGGRNFEVIRIGVSSRLPNKKINLYKIFLTNAGTSYAPVSVSPVLGRDEVLGEMSIPPNGELVWYSLKFSVGLNLRKPVSIKFEDWPGAENKLVDKIVEFKSDKETSDQNYGERGC